MNNSSGKIKCVIIDDEYLARDLLSQYIDKVPSLELIGSFENPLDIFNTNLLDTVDIMFLDIQMPEITGIDFLKSLRKQPAVIFTTAYQQYAIEAYELNVIEYLLKPIAFPRFLKAVKKVSEIIKLRRIYKNGESKENNADDNSFILVKSERKLHKLKDVIYIESALEYVVFHLSNRSITAYYSLKELEGLLPSSIFSRVHRSFIVNNDYIDSLDSATLMLGNVKIPLGASYRKKIIDQFSS